MTIVCPQQWTLTCRYPLVTFMRTCQSFCVTVISISYTGLSLLHLVTKSSCLASCHCHIWDTKLASKNYNAGITDNVVWQNVLSCVTHVSETQTDVYCSLFLGMKYLRKSPVEWSSFSKLGVFVRVVCGAICKLNMQKFLYNSLQILSRCCLLLASHMNHICNKKSVTTRTTLHCFVKECSYFTYTFQEDRHLLKDPLQSQ